MILYIIKFILCSAFFYSIYKLLLENESMHHFNRFYLLISIIISFAIPLIPIGTISKISNPKIDTLIFYHHESTSNLIQTDNLLSNTSMNYSEIILIIYFCVTFLVLIRFLFNIYKVYKKKNYNLAIPYFNSKIIMEMRVMLDIW